MVKKSSECLEENDAQEVSRPMPFDDVGDLGDSIHLWTIPLDGPAARQAHDARLLSTDEAARAARFRFARDRRRFIAGRGALRRILAHYLAAAPEALRFAYGAAGKPALAQPQAGRPIQFNLSHCEHLGLLAVAHDRALGVDIERVRRASDLASLAQRFFAPQEAAALADISPPHHERAFFACWTRKEAFLNAFGAGLSVPLDGFCGSVDPDRPARLLATRWRPAEAGRWSLADIALDPDFRAAIAIEGPLGEVRSWHLSEKPEEGSARIAPPRDHP